MYSKVTQAGEQAVTHTIPYNNKGKLVEFEIET